MAEPKGVAFLPGQDPGTVAANREYQQALDRMLATLDARKNRMFDPTLLAMAEGFLKPAPTFGESLGHVAGAVRQSQEREADVERKLAEAQLNLAGRGLELERQKARERAFQQLGGVGAPAAEEAPAGAPGAVPGGAPGQAPTAGPVGAATVAQGVAQAGAGRLAAPERVLSRREFMALQASEGAVSPAQAESNWAEYQKRVAETERGRAEAERALAEMGERQIYGSTYRVPIQIARKLDDAQASGDAARYRAVADQFLRGVGLPPRGVAESEIEKAAEMERQKVLAARSANLEADVPQARSDALQIRGAADRIMRDVSMFPQAFGVFEKPGVMAAFATLIDEGLSLGTTRVNLAGFRRAVTQADPSMSQAAIDALLRFAGNKAEIELLYRRKYLSGQGQGSISNMEQAIIPNLIGSEKDTPQSLMDKVRLLSLRAQFDVKVAQKWKELSRANPRLTYLQFKNSDEYEKMEEQYDQVLSRELTHLVPRSVGAAPTQPSGALPAVVSPATPPARPAVATPVPATSSAMPQLGPATGRVRRDESLPMPGGAPFSNAARRLESLFPTR
jgi:hypothetical protein